MKFATNFLLVFIALWIGDPDMSAVAQDALPEQGAEAKLFAVEIKVGPGWDNAKTPNEEFVHLPVWRKIDGDDLFHDRDMRFEP